MGSQEVKEGYKLTEVGVIPEDWEVKKLGDIAEIATGNTPNTKDYTNYGDEFLFVSPVDLGNHKYIFSTEKKLSSKGFSQARVFPVYSILFTCIGSTIGKIGIASQILTSNQQINAIFPNESYKTNFLFYILSYLAPQIKASASEQAVPILNKSAFSKVLVNYPPLHEQEKIAQVLSDFDSAIAHLDKLISKKRNVKQGTMQQLLTGKKRLPGFSGEWEIKPFSSILIRLNATKYQVQTMDYQVTGKYPIVDQGKEFIVGFSDREDKKFRCPEGGIIIFGDHTCIVKFINFDFLIGADGTQIIQGKSQQNTQFHAFQLQYRGIEPTGYNRHFKFLAEHEFLVPPISEQKAIAQVLSDMDAEIEALENKRNKYQAIKQGMMQELLTGKTRLK